MDIDRTSDALRFRLPSDVRLVDQITLETKMFLKNSGLGGDSSPMLVLRELTNNGIEHGNSRDTSLSVEVTVQILEGGRLRIHVKDEGPGFDHDRAKLSLPDDPTQVRNRGLALVNNFVDELRFLGTGNEVEAYMTINSETYFNITDDGDWKVIEPSGDLTAVVADEFRQTLLNLLQEGFHKFRFNLEKVEDIDSITLSIFVIFSNTLGKSGKDTELEVVGAARDIVNMFQLTRLDRSYKIVQ